MKNENEKNGKEKEMRTYRIDIEARIYELNAKVESLDLVIDELGDKENFEENYEERCEMIDKSFKLITELNKAKKELEEFDKNQENNKFDKFVNNVIADVNNMIEIGELENDFYSVYDYLKMNYRADCPEGIYENMVEIVTRPFKA